MSDFVHLHVHTQYSLLDGVNRSDKLFEKVKASGMDAVAISDHGVLYGVPEFWKMAKDFGVKPIIGCEIYLSPKEHTIKQDIDGIRYYHLLLLAKNEVGYRNLIKIVTKGHLEGMYYKPRVDIEILRKHSEGLICTSACLAGPLSRHIIKDQLNIAEKWLKELHSIFKDNFYLEIQRNGLCKHDEIDQEAIDNLPANEVEENLQLLQSQIKVNKQLYKYADQYKIPVVATTDAHYLDAGDKEIQKVLFCIKDGKTLEDPTAMNGYLETYIKTPEELIADFEDIPEVLLETVKINEKIENFSIGYNQVQPKFWNLPKELNAQDQLYIEVYRGAYRKYKERRIKDKELDEDKLDDLEVEEIKNALDPELNERLDYELKVIHDKGFDDYFLVVSDIMKWAGQNGILTGVRGSVAGSAAAYCLDIVEIDPIGWQLYFERFLNPERPSPPDIDMDIQDSRRDELIDYVKEKYGAEAVAAICAIGRLKTKAAIRDVARTMGVNLATADKLSKMVVVLFGKPYKFKQMMEDDLEFRTIVESDPQLIKLGEIVSKVEGLARHMSVHACGHLITPGPIIDFAALQHETGGGRVITQWEGPWIEEIGLMKFDFLGLRTLSIISDTIKYIKNKRGVEIDYFNIPNDDKATYDLFSRGETIGVFQFESPPMQQYLIELQPETQEDLCFMAAAYRPGPMKYIPDYIKCKHGQKEPEFLVPELQDIVGYTYGFAIYQEQVIKIAVDLGGYSMGGADILRRAMGKKKMDVMQKEEAVFKSGVMAKGYSEEVAAKLWSYLLPFADYGFNKAHSAGYAVLAYKCAYLKAHYPLEFMTALMHADLMNTDRVTVDIKEARRLGYSILQPSINRSFVYFEPEGESGIRFGLGAIKNVGAKLCEQIVKERELNGEFKHFDDFVNRIGPKNINKRTVECLIKAGAMDEFGDRNALLIILPQVFEKAERDLKAQEMGQTGLFSMNLNHEHDGINEVEATRFPSFTPASDRERMNWEKELMGLYISIHPLEKFTWVNILKPMKATNELENISNGSEIKMLGMISKIKITHTKKDNQKMAIVTIEDMHGTVDAVIFPKTFDKLNNMHLVEEGRPFLFTGQVNYRDDRMSIIINDIEPAGSLMRPKKIKIDIAHVYDQTEIECLKNVFVIDGDTEIEVKYGNNGNSKVMVKKARLDDEYSVECLKKFVI